MRHLGNVPNSDPNPFPVRRLDIPCERLLFELMGILKIELFPMRLLAISPYDFGDPKRKCGSGINLSPY